MVRAANDQVMHHVVARFAVTVATAIALAVGAGVPGAAAPSAAPQTPRFTARDCGALPAIDVRVTCSWLPVPERRDRKGSKTIRLAVAVLHSRAATPEPDPVVFLSGGPGDAAIADGLTNFATSPMLANRDIILFDQRGTGLSEPSLNCPEREKVALRDIGRAAPAEVETAAIRKATLACRDRLRDSGIDLDGYDTEASAADVADLRTALGVRQWNIFGVSYGTRLALATMRSHPEGIRTAVLDSVYPPDVAALTNITTAADAAIERLFAACDVDAGCAAAHPNLRQTFGALVDKLNATPVEVRLPSGEALVITGDDVVAGVFDALYDTATIPAIPTILERLAAGDTSVVQLRAAASIKLLVSPSEGVNLSVECADAAKFSGSKRVAKAVAAPGHRSVLVRNAPQPYCDAWGVGPLPDAFSRPVRSAIPTLVLAGSLDPITPASQSRRAAKALRNARYVEFPGFGHGVTNGTVCPRAIRQAFLDDPEAKLDTSCVDSLKVVFS